MPMVASSRERSDTRGDGIVRRRAGEIVRVAPLPPVLLPKRVTDMVFDEPTRLHRFNARHKVALRVIAILVAVAVCGGAVWLVADGSEWWILLVPLLSVLSVYNIWQMTKGSERLVRDHAGKAARDR
ncbi:hypothetical protein IF650_01565 [Cellulosimicrobium terreum]|nr:hypothetical protein [Cellulosimicrobium terreum]